MAYQGRSDFYVNITMSLCALKPGVHLIVTIAVIVQKQTISAIVERYLSHVHLFVPIVQKSLQDHIFGAKSKST